jgi:hypothetical protein
LYDNLLVTWSSKDNTINVDFELYSTLNDAQKGQYKWKYCNYNDNNIAFPRDCGVNRKTNSQWTSFTRGGKQNYAWSVLSQKKDLLSAGLLDLSGKLTIPKKMSLWVRDTSEIRSKGCKEKNKLNLIQVGRYCDGKNDCSNWMDNQCTKFSDTFGWGFDSTKNFKTLSKHFYACVIPDVRELPIISSVGKVSASKKSTAYPEKKADQLKLYPILNDWSSGIFYSARSPSFDQSSNFRGLQFTCESSKQAFVGIN